MKLLNSHLLLHFELADPLPRIEALMNERPAIMGALVERLFLYDELVIPTCDFSVVPVLTSWLGDDLFTEMVQTGAIRFLRYRGSLGYSGNGVGLVQFSLEKGEAPDWKPWQEAASAEPERAAEIWLERMRPDLNPSARDKIASSVIAHSEELIRMTDFDRKVVHETYMDALESPSLRALFGIRSTDMTRLHGIRSDQLRVFRPQGMRVYKNVEEVDILLGMAAANFELCLAQLAHADDVAFDPSVEQFLIGKAERVLDSTDLARGFVEILNVNDLPDLAAAAASGAVSPAEIWRIRNRGSAVAFRQWFHENVRDEPDRAVNEYVAAVGKVTWLDKFPGKALRFALTSAASLLGPGAGTVVGAFDSFLLDSIVKGYSPKYLIDDLRRILPPATTEVRR